MGPGASAVGARLEAGTHRARGSRTRTGLLSRGRRYWPQKLGPAKALIGTEVAGINVPDEQQGGGGQQSRR